MDMKEVAKFETPASLKLSEAIRIGARLRTQAMRVLADENGNTCALGAAAHARGWNPDCDNSATALAFLADVHRTPLWDTIGLRNDNGETREQIADWLEAQGL